MSENRSDETGHTIVVGFLASVSADSTANAQPLPLTSPIRARHPSPRFSGSTAHQCCRHSWGGGRHSLPVWMS